MNIICSQGWERYLKFQNWNWTVKQSRVGEALHEVHVQNGNFDCLPSFFLSRDFIICTCRSSASCSIDLIRHLLFLKSDPWTHTSCPTLSKKIYGSDQATYRLYTLIKCFGGVIRGYIIYQLYIYMNYQ
jgi:hypothetical protein